MGFLWIPGWMSCIHVSAGGSSRSVGFVVTLPSQTNGEQWEPEGSGNGLISSTTTTAKLCGNGVTNVEVIEIMRSLFLLGGNLPIQSSASVAWKAGTVSVWSSFSFSVAFSTCLI